MNHKKYPFFVKFQMTNDNKKNLGLAIFDEYFKR